MAATVAASLFAALDKDGDGKVSPSELRRGMAAALGGGVSEADAVAIVVAADADGDGLLDHDEFLTLAREAEQPPSEDCRWKCLRTAFGMYADAVTTTVTAGAGEKGGGVESLETIQPQQQQQQCITPESLRRMLGRLGAPRMGLEECKAMIRRFDLNGDGVLTFDEFKVMMHDGFI